MTRAAGSTRPPPSVLNVPAGACGTKPNRMTGTRMNTKLPRIPARPPHRRTLLSALDDPSNPDTMAQRDAVSAKRLTCRQHVSRVPDHASKIDLILLRVADEP